MTMQETGETLADIRGALERVRNDGNAALFTLKNGIVLRCRPVPPIYMRTLAERFTPPPVPKVRIERGDDSYEEENPSDPAWIAEVEALAKRTNTAVTHLVFGMGTEVESVPDGMFKPGDQGWVDYVRKADKFTGIETPLDLTDDDMRYISWLEFYALDNNTDLQLAGLLPQFLAGPAEVEIAQAVDAFRDYRSRGEPENGVSPDADTDGHRGNRAARRRRQ